MLNNWKSFGGVAKKNLILHFGLNIKIRCFWMETALPTYPNPALRRRGNVSLYVPATS